MHNILPERFANATKGKGLPIYALQRVNVDNQTNRMVPASIFFKREPGRNLTALAITLLIYALVVLTTPLTYQVGDDAYYRGIVSGYVTGNPDAHAFWTGYILSSALAKLYLLTPEIPWYDLAESFVVDFSCFITARAILKHCHLNGLSVLVATSVSTLFCFAFFAYPMGIMNFSTTALLPATACSATILTLGKAPEDTGKTILTDVILCCLLMACACQWRFFMFEADLAFLFAAAIARLLFSNTDLRKTIACLLAAISIIGLCGLAINKIAYSSEDWAAFEQYNTARAHYMDYPHETYAENPNAYSNQGWSKSLYQLVAAKFLMDQKINPETFNTLSGGNDSATKAISSYSSFFFTSRPLALASILVLFPLMLYVSIMLFRRRSSRDAVEALTAISIITLAFMMVLLYCLYKNNLYYRHFAGLIPLPYIAVIFGLALGVNPANKAPHGMHAKHKAKTSAGAFVNSATIIALCALLIPATNSYLVLQDSSRQSTISTRTAAFKSTLDYCSSHKDLVFFGDIFPSFQVFYSHPKNLESNYIFWGHFQSMMYSPLYREKIAALDLEYPPYSDAYLNSNVRVLLSNTAHENALITYMQERYGAKLTWDVVAEIPIIRTVTANEYVEEVYNPFAWTRNAETEESSIRILDFHIT